MKISIVAICLTLASAGVMAGNNNVMEAPDTLLSVRNARTVTVAYDRSVVRVSVDGCDGDSTARQTLSVVTDQDVTVRSGQLAGHLPFLSRNCLSCSSDWSAVMGGIGFGFVNAVGGEAGRYVEMGKSFEIAVLNLIGVSYSVPGCMADVTIGFGIDWKNYRITTPDIRFATSGEDVTMEPYPAGVTPKNSRIKVFSLGVPVYWEQRFPVNVMGGDRFSIALGAVLGYATHAGISTTWIDGSGRKIRDKANDIGHRRFTADLLGIVRISSDMGLYVRYSPATVLTGQSSPQFRSFSTGLIIGY